MAEVFYTQTYEITLHQTISFLSYHSDLNSAIDTALKAQGKFEKRMSNQPDSCQKCMELNELGVTDCYEYHVGNFRIIYFFDVSLNQVSAISITQQKQSLRKLAENIFFENLNR